MSYLKAKDITDAEKKYGKPDKLTTVVKATPAELNDIRLSQKHGRAHDITVFIYKNSKFLFIAKHFYPEGLFRAPSGAARPGENLIDGGKREALEETGVEVEFERYLLRIMAKFKYGDDCIDWASHIFLAKYVSGEVGPTDTEEIREARFVDVNEIPLFNETMSKIGSAGFRYRIFLTQNTMKVLEKDKAFKSIIHEN